MVSFFQSTVDANSGAGKELATFIHVDYKYYQPEWEAIRDAIAGERRIKNEGGKYLPKLDVEYGTSYETYKERAVFVNMTARTVLGLVGTVFRRPIKVTTDPIRVGVQSEAAADADAEVVPVVAGGVSAQVKADRQLKEDMKNVTIDGLDLNLFAKKIAFELCSVGRVGVLVDMPQSGVAEKPYLTEYIAENILSWRTKVVEGREVLSYVLLREIVEQTVMLDGTFVPATMPQSIPIGGLTARYRVLMLNDAGEYVQRVYNLLSNDVQLSQTSFTEIQPTRGGKPLDFIPFVIMGAMSPTAEVQKSPIFDIVTLNLAHYRTSAQLEHGRYYTALPVYYVPLGPGQEQGEYQIGPSVVWETPADSKPGILEYYGTGLRSLSDSLHEKEEYIAQLGGRLMGIAPTTSGESDATYKLKQANEMSILLNITESMNAGLTRAFVWYQDWQRKNTKGLQVKINQDFKSLQIAARELRALALLYQEGILPVQAVYDALQAAEFLSEDISFSEFISLLDNLDNFPNQPDVAAMHEGYPDATSRLLDEQSLRGVDSSESQAEMDRQHQILIDQRRSDQQSDLQTQMFTQGKRTMQYQTQLQEQLETVKSGLKQNEIRTAAKVAPKPAAGTKTPAKKSPAGAKPTTKSASKPRPGGQNSA